MHARVNPKSNLHREQQPARKSKLKNFWRRRSRSTGSSSYGIVRLRSRPCIELRVCRQVYVYIWSGGVCVCRARAINLKGVLIVVVLITQRACNTEIILSPSVFHPLIANLMNLFFPRRCFVSRDTCTRRKWLICSTANNGQYASDLKPFELVTVCESNLILLQSNEMQSV